MPPAGDLASHLSSCQPSRYAASFCLAARLLDGVPPERWFAAGGNPFVRLVNGVVWQSSIDTIEGYSFYQAPSSLDDRLRLTSFHARITTAIAAMGYHLHWVYHHSRNLHPNLAPHQPTDHALSAREHFHRSRPAPPSTIPLASFMRPPPPFGAIDHADDPLRFATCHLHATTAPEFLADGAWVGYTFSRVADSKIGRAIRRVRFEAIESGPAPLGDAPPAAAAVEHGRMTHLTACDAADARGPFRMRGEVCRATGRLRLRKLADLESREEDWAGVVTPFGLAGGWCHSSQRMGSADGWFWLWKEEWAGPWEQAGGSAAAPTGEV